MFLFFFKLIFYFDNFIHVYNVFCLILPCVILFPLLLSPSLTFMSFFFNVCVEFFFGCSFYVYVTHSFSFETGSQTIAKDDLKLICCPKYSPTQRDPLPSASQVLGFQVWATVLGSRSAVFYSIELTIFKWLIQQHSLILCNYRFYVVTPK